MSKKTCNLFCNIAAKRVGGVKVAMLRVLLLTISKPVLQKIRLLQVAKICCRKYRVVLLQKLRQNLYMLRVLPAQGKLVPQHVT